MTLGQILIDGAGKLNQRQITNPHLEAEILLSKILKKPREFILAHGENKLTAEQIKNFQSLVFRRLKGEPIAYLTGHKEFYGLNFKVNKNVLIPRPETELMVEEALKLVARSSSASARQRRDGQPVTLADIGTGSGCIIIALAKQNINGKLLATDISAKALAVARQNAKNNHVDKKIKFLKGGLLEPIVKNKLIINRQPLIILANLPYLTPTQIKNSPTIKYEPKLALAAGSDGLKYYRRLFKQIKTS
ncbi:MAG: peptide chain release factor N(5)-glutamine methyltransferase, partial [bacterium]|nr:peptide chain release factor N(5)-glutamine methyltransferase [bacterium]